MTVTDRTGERASRGKDVSRNPLTRDVINERFRIAIANTRHMRVVREDVLGEGAGAWDSDPRYPTNDVNCIVWLQLLISEVYGHGASLEEKTRIMDRVRYYKGCVAYGMRKCHYLDLWLKLEPEPLRRLKPADPGLYKYASVEVDKKRFKAFHNYTCELYREDLSSFDIEYLAPEDFLACVGQLAPGYYVGLPAASPYYLSLYGEGCGPMGLVHSFLLEVRTPTDAGHTVGAPKETHVVYHASTLSGSIKEVPLPDYVRDMQKIFIGYTLYEPDENWDFHTPQEEDEAAVRIRRCEATLPRNEDNRKL